MKSKSTRISAILGVLILMLAVVIAALVLDRGADSLMIGVDLLLVATSMELFRRAHPPAS